MLWWWIERISAVLKRFISLDVLSFLSHTKFLLADGFWIRFTEDLWLPWSFLQLHTYIHIYIYNIEEIVECCFLHYSIFLAVGLRLLSSLVQALCVS